MDRKIVVLQKPKTMYIYGLCCSKSICMDYIGKTRSIIDRLPYHIQEAMLGKKKSIKNNWLKAAIEGGYSIYIILIEICNEYNVDEREIYWIARYKNFTKLKNMTNGGTGGTTHYGKPTKTKREDGVIFNSVKEAGEKSGCNRSAIHSCLSGKNLTAGGYQWFRPDDEIIMRKKKDTVRTKDKDEYIGKKVFCSNGSTYLSVNNAARTLNIVAPNIAKCIRGERPSAGGLLFWEEGGTPIAKKPMFTKPILCTTTNVCYISARKAAEDLNLNFKQISAVCNKKQSSCHGYHFEFILKEEE